MALNTTPGPACESLCSAVEADAYHDSRGNSARWAVLDQFRKEQLLRQAYDRLYGDYASQWPDDAEFGAGDALGTIPARVRDACALLALYALEAPLDAPPSTAPQVIEKTVGPLTTKYAQAATIQRRTFPDVARMVAPYLVKRAAAYSAKLVRS